MSVMLLTEHHLEFLSLKCGCTGSSEYILVKMQHCWKSHVAARNSVCLLTNQSASTSLSSHVPNWFLSPLALLEAGTLHTTWGLSDRIVYLRPSQQLWSGGGGGGQFT